MSPADVHHLRAIEGWLELGNPGEAQAEFDQMAPALREHPELMILGARIQAGLGQWAACVAIGEKLVRTAPDRPQGWIDRSYALHELKRTQEALDQLRPAAERFPDIWTIPYNLGCYCAQLGRLADAETWLRKALAMDAAAVWAVAMTDPDLKPLHRGREGMSWLLRLK